MKALLISFASVLALPAMAQDTPEALLESFIAAVHAEDRDALGALYLDTAVSYGLDGTTANGGAEIGASWGGLFDAFDDIKLTADLNNEVQDGSLAAAWGTFTMSATPTEGGDEVVWSGRFTDVSTKTENGWRYIVDHVSLMVPPADSE